MMFYVILLAVALTLPESKGVHIQELIDAENDIVQLYGNETLEKLRSHDKNDSLKDLPKPVQLGGRSGHTITIPKGYFERQCTESGTSQACADICFIVQTSCCKNAEDVMNSIKRDIDTIMDKLGNQSRFTIVTYSSDANSQIGWLKTGEEIRSRKIFKSGKKCDDCQALTHKALKACRKKIETLRKNDIGEEKFFSKNIVIFTDGISSSTKRNPEKARLDTLAEALLIQRSTDINIQVVQIDKGEVGDKITGEEEWSTLQMPKPSADFVNVGKLGLDADQDVDIIFHPCGEEKIEIECCTADVVFIVDRSNSITKKDVNITLEFFDDFIKVQQRIIEPNIASAQGLRIAVISYGRYVETHAHLGEYGQAGLISVISKISRTTNKYTHTHEALDAALNELKTNGRNQSHVRKIVVIFTDGRTWKKDERKAYEGNDTIDAAQRIKDFGGEMYVTGLPNYKNRSDGYDREWKFIASPPIECTIVNMQVKGAIDGPFTELEYAGRHLTMEICKTGNVTCPWEKP